MATCEHCHNVLLDFVYGLLEETEAQEVREHLTACPTCQAALEKVQAQQKLLAHAARVIDKVPEFALPSHGTADAPQSPAEPVSRRSLWRRPWVAWATAAAVLLAVTASISLYRQTIHAYETELTAQRQGAKKAERFLAEVPLKYAALQQAALQEVRAQATPHLHVVGPTQLQAGARANLHITTRHPEGDLVPAKVTVKLVQEATQKVIQQATVQSAGEARVEMHSVGADAGKLNVVVEAATAFGPARLSEPVQQMPPSYVTRLDTNKAIYQVGEVLFYRALVVDRYTLRPPPQPIAMKATLLNSKGQAEKQRQLATRSGGILAGELPIDKDIQTGEHVLAIEPALPQTTSVQPVTQRLQIVRDLRVP
jgi:hypothetical protein